MKRSIIFILIFCNLLVAAKRPAIVETAKIKEGYVNAFTKLTGTIHFEQNSDISTQIKGLVKDVYFTSGDRVKKGQLLATLDSEELDASIEALKNKYDSLVLKYDHAKKDFNRYKKLLAQNSVSKKIYDDSYYSMAVLKSEVLEVEFELKKLKVLKKQKSIKTPFSGIITEKTVQKGQWLKEGAKVANLIAYDKINVLFDIPSDYISTLHQDAIYELRIRDKIYKAKLYAVIPKGDTLTRMFPIKFQLDIKNSDFLFDGMSASVNIPTQKKQKTFLVPRDGVIKKFKKNVVFIVDDNQAKMVPVEIIGYEKSLLGIKSTKLKAGDEVIIKGNERIAPKQPLKIVN